MTALRHLALAAVVGATLSGQTLSVSGTVVDARSSAPLARVRVTLFHANGNPTSKYAVTASDGKFIFDDLQQGSYRIHASRRQYLAQLYGHHPSIAAAGSSIVVGSGNPSDGLLFRLYPAGRIAGTVTAAGEPVAAGFVQVFGTQFIAGRRQILLRGSGYTNAEGKYAIGGLVPGVYYVGVTARPWFSNPLTPSTPLEKSSWPPTYFPSVTNPAAASAVVVEAGNDSDADIELTPAAASSISLSFAAAVPDFLSLMSEGPGGSSLYWPTTGKPYRLLLPPGRYHIEYTAPGSDSPTLQSFEVSNSDANVEFVAPKQGQLNAVVEVRGIPPLEFHGLFLSLAREHALTRHYPFSTAGALTVSNLVPGKYLVTLESRTRPFLYTEKMVAEGAQYDRGYLTVPPGANVQLRVSAVAHVGAVTGKVLRGDRPVFGKQVILARKEPRGELDDLQVNISGSDGSFQFQVVRPGDYYVFAAVGDEPLEFANPKVLATYLPGALLVNVEPGVPSDIVLDLRELPAPTVR